MDVAQVIYLFTVEGHLDCFQLGVIMNRADTLFLFPLRKQRCGLSHYFFLLK